MGKDEEMVKRDINLMPPVIYESLVTSGGAELSKNNYSQQLIMKDKN
jgi:hypothetical protein